MTHREKVQFVIADLGKRGVGSLTVAPPLYRLLWLLRIEVSPPHFQNFLSLALLTGSLFGVLSGGLMWLSYRQSIGMTLLLTLFLGATFGLLLAAYYNWSARRLSLPTWEEYQAPE